MDAVIVTQAVTHWSFFTEAYRSDGFADVCICAADGCLSHKRLLQFLH